MHCDALCCTALWCAALWCDALWCTVLWCDALHSYISIWCSMHSTADIYIEKSVHIKITVSCSGLEQCRWQKSIDFAAFGNKPATPALSFLALRWFLLRSIVQQCCCARLYNVHSDHCCILLAGGSVCAHPDGAALIWELGRLLLRLRTHNGGHQIGTQYVRDTGSLTWEFRRKMLLRFRKHNGLFLDFYR